MSKLIKLLDSHIVNQIAAGEVVSRPESIVKELVENSIDSGATEIKITLTDGGISLISVSDNGYGIDKDQLDLAITKHATSKLDNLEDLLNIHSFGFRGEALSTISAVAHTKIISTTKDNQTYCLIKDLDSKAQIQLNNQQIPVGTIVEVRNLFAKIPARQKFLKSANLEFNYIFDTIRKFAVNKTYINWTLVHNNKVILKTKAIYQGPNAITDLVKEIYPKNFEDPKLFTADEFVELKQLAKPWFINNASIVIDMLPFQNARHQAITIFLNDRIIKDKVIISAIKLAIQDLNLMPPSMILYFDMDLTSVDINVHPAKEEVRYTEAKLVHSFVCDFIKVIYQGKQEDNPFIKHALNEKELTNIDYQDARTQMMANQSKSMPSLFVKSVVKGDIQSNKYQNINQVSTPKLFDQKQEKSTVQNHKGNYLHRNGAISSQAKEIAHNFHKRLNQFGEQQCFAAEVIKELKFAKIEFLTWVNNQAIFKTLRIEETNVVEQLYSINLEDVLFNSSSNLVELVTALDLSISNIPELPPIVAKFLKLEVQDNKVHLIEINQLLTIKLAEELIYQIIDQQLKTNQQVLTAISAILSNDKVQNYLLSKQVLIMSTIYQLEADKLTQILIKRSLI